MLGFLALGSQGCSYAGVWQAFWTFGVGWKLNPPHILCRSRLASRSPSTLDQAHLEGQASSCTTLGRDFTNCLQRKWGCLGSNEAPEPLHMEQRCNGSKLSPSNRDTQRLIETTKFVHIPPPPPPYLYDITLGYCLARAHCFMLFIPRAASHCLICPSGSRSRLQATFFFFSFFVGEE